MTNSGVYKRRLRVWHLQGYTSFRLNLTWVDIQLTKKKEKELMQIKIFTKNLRLEYSMTYGIWRRPLTTGHFASGFFDRAPRFCDLSSPKRSLTFPLGSGIMSPCINFSDSKKNKNKLKPLGQIRPSCQSSIFCPVESNC